MVAADSVGPHEFDTGNKFDDLQLFDLVIDPPDLGLFIFKPAQLIGLFVADSPYAFDHGPA